MRSLLSKGINEFVRLNLLLLACMVVMRPVFFLEVHTCLGVPFNLFPVVLSGTLFDVLLVCRIFVFGLLPFLLLYRFFPKIARGVFVGLIVLYVVVSALLSEYYCQLTMPLDHVILVYTAAEIRETLFSSASFSWPPVLWFLAFLSLPTLLICLWRKLRLGQWLAVSLAVVFLLLTLLVPYHRMIRKEQYYTSHERFCLAVNHPSYACLKTRDYLHDLRKAGFSEVEVNKAVEAYHALHPEFDYDVPGYPFYRKFTDPDVLGGLLDKTSDGLPPNFVFIIVEGLGRDLTGVYNPKMSFTPFLDSLATRGLYWPNALSTSARTFGVLPSVFASAPHGRYGFSTSLAPTPRHNSLLLDLKRNGYTTAFYYGGNMAFDGYEVFMKASQVDVLFEPDLQVLDSTRFKKLSEKNRWGLDDGQLFQCAIQNKAGSTQDDRPFADVFLTLTTHEPFEIDGMETYEAQVRAMVEATPGISAPERDNILKNTNIFGCYLYTDQNIRALFSYYAQRPDFENTVFVITGDHRMAYLPIGTAIHSYNVPLILYSPLVRTPKTMLPIVSHLDITPSVNAYLRDNYEYSVDSHCHWLGTALDTTAAFGSQQRLLFMLNNRDVVDYLQGEYLLSRKYLIKLDADYIGALMDDDTLYQKLKQELMDFDLVSRFVVQQDLLIPKN